MLVQFLGACRRGRRMTRVDLNVPRDASYRAHSEATLRFDLALGARHRHAPNRFLSRARVADVASDCAGRNMVRHIDGA